MAVIGARAFRNRLTKEIPAEIQAVNRKDLALGADELVRTMITTLNAQIVNRTGAAISSITWEPGGGRSRHPSSQAVTIKAGNAETMVQGARGRRFQLMELLEWGTVKMAPRKFFWNTYSVLRRRIKSRITRNMKKAIEKFN